MIENEEPLAKGILSSLYPFSGNAFVIGITGPPGAGKSTLLSCLIEEALTHKYHVGVIAVDPSSPLTGGALLADRLRMSSTNHQQVYIRSLATRGSVGGLAYASFGILRVLEAMGKDFIFVETVGAGQDEIAVSNLAATTIYVTVPHLGDEIQALKAGILEVSDIFIVNKSDLGQSEITISQLRSALTVRGGGEKAWKPPILSASASQGKGIAQIFSTILSHQDFLTSSGEGKVRRRRQVSQELMTILEKSMWQEIRSKLTEEALERLLNKKLDPHSLARKILSKKWMLPL